jgi:hypothetical protein
MENNSEYENRILNTDSIEFKTLTDKLSNIEVKHTLSMRTLTELYQVNNIKKKLIKRSE